MIRTAHADSRFSEFIKDIGNGILLSFQKCDVNKTKWSELKDTMKARLKDVLSYSSDKKTDDDIEIESRLKESVIEHQMTEFKIGLVEVKSNANKSIALKMKEIVKTLVAMRNTANEKEGLVIVGIADNYSQAESWKAIYSESFSIVEQHVIVGVEKEAISVYGKLDSYIQAIKDSIKRQSVSEKVCNEILQSFRLSYFSQARKQLLIFRCKPKPDECEKYDGIVYVRNGNSTEKRTV